MSDLPPNRCRLVVILDDHGMTCLSSLSEHEQDVFFGTSDIASLIFHLSEQAALKAQSEIKLLIDRAQSAGIACLIANNSQLAGRMGADGLHVVPYIATAQETIDQHANRFMIGIGSVKTRHAALLLGELQPDYVMFGALDGDLREEPHPKNLALGDWWSSMVEIPCIVLGGNSTESVVAVAKSGAEFVALRSAIFPPDQTSTLTLAQLQERLKQVNDILDEHAPTFEDDEHV